MKITVEHEGHELVLNDHQLEEYTISSPSDVHVGPDGRRELARTHFVLVALLKEAVRAEWRKIGA